MHYSDYDKSCIRCITLATHTQKIEKNRNMNFCTKLGAQAELLLVFGRYILSLIDIFVTYVKHVHFVQNSVKIAILPRLNLIFAN